MTLCLDGIKVKIEHLYFFERVVALAYFALHFLLPTLGLAEKRFHPLGNHFLSRLIATS
jgi:hypothetical protein